MKVKISNNITITNPNNDLLLYCNEKLKIDNPDYLSAKKAGRWTGNISEKIFLFKRIDNRLIIPFGCINDIYKFIKNADIETNLHSCKSNLMKGGITLYPYQEIALNQLISKKNGILKAPCGSGKTQIGLALIKALGKKTLWLTHTRDLLVQSKSRCEQYYKGDFGTITDGKINIGRDITFATVQTMSKIDLSSLKYEFEMVIVDECHRCAGSPTKLTQFYKVVDALATRYKYGLTATIHRSDSLVESVYSLLGRCAYEISQDDVNTTMKAEINERYIDTPSSLNYCDTDGTLIYSSLISYLCENVERNKIIIDDLKNEHNNYCLILTSRVEHCYELQKLLNAGEVCVGKISKKKRIEIFDDTRKGNNHYIFSTYNLAKEGLDIPILNRLFLVTPQKDFAIVKQSVGRIERKNDANKKDAIVYDYIDKNIGYCLGSFKKRKRIYNK